MRNSAVIPAKAGIHNPELWIWIPALASLGRDDSLIEVHR
jgi:hypothetical protein